MLSVIVQLTADIIKISYHILVFIKVFKTFATIVILLIPNFIVLYVSIVILLIVDKIFIFLTILEFTVNIYHLIT